MKKFLLAYLAILLFIMFLTSPSHAGIFNYPTAKEIYIYSGSQLIDSYNDVKYFVNIGYVVKSIIIYSYKKEITYYNVSFKIVK